MLASIANRWEKIGRNFLWSNDETSSGFHWVNWREVFCSKQGGWQLGMRPLWHVNEALKTKWLWCFIKEGNALWRNVIIAKYGVGILVWWTMKIPFAHRIGCWKSILSGLERFKSWVHLEVKNGSRVRFWHDVWCEDQPLKIQFLDLFRM